MSLQEFEWLMKNQGKENTWSMQYEKGEAIHNG